MNSVPGSVTAVIAAAGSGQRLGAGGPKAFVELAGRPMIGWSLEALRAAPSVGPIIVAAPPGHEHGLDGDDVEVVDGGAARAESVRNALAAVETELVAIHDAARPLLTPELVEEVVGVLAGDPEADGAIAAAPVADTIKRAASAHPPAFSTGSMENAGGVVSETLDRSELWAAQTPQAFRVAALRRALGADPAAVAAATDEAMLIEVAGGRVLICPTRVENLKVTTDVDLRIADFLIGDRK